MKPCFLVLVCASLAVGDVPDLRQFEAAPGATIQQQTKTQLAYDTDSSILDAFHWEQRRFEQYGWQELDGTYESDASCSGAFKRDGYRISLTAYGTGEPGKSKVQLMQHGNVDLRELPLPKNLTVVYVGPASTSYTANGSVDDTKRECSELLVKDGWEPYGVAGDSLMFRKGANRLNAFISAAAALQGKTMLQFSSEMLSAEIPAFPGSTNVQYSDQPAQLFFDSGKSMEEVVKFYREKLGSTGWQPTTESLIKVSIYDVMIFRNPAKEMLELQLHNFEGQARGLLKYLTAAEVDELDRLAKAAAERAKQPKQEAPLPRLTLKLPADSKVNETESRSFEAEVPAGKARATVEGWRKDLLADGWKDDSSVLQREAGAVSLSKDSQSLTLHYHDTGFLPAEIGVSSVGIEVEASLP